MIYIDLDDCLVAQNYDTQPSRSVLRPGALELLHDLRLIGEIFLISAGTIKHVHARNDQHKLGFPVKNIIAREDLYQEEHAYRESHRIIPLKRDQCPGAVLIDNNPHDYPYTAVKLEWLGIKPEQFIQVPNFYGASYKGFAEQDLTDQIPDILAKVRTILKLNEPTTPNPKPEST
jgi:hypothetical protein